MYRFAVDMNIMNVMEFVMDVCVHMCYLCIVIAEILPIEYVCFSVKHTEKTRRNCFIMNQTERVLHHLVGGAKYFVSKINWLKTIQFLFLTVAVKPLSIGKTWEIMWWVFECSNVLTTIQPTLTPEDKLTHFPEENKTHTLAVNTVSYLGSSRTGKHREPIILN